MSNVVVKEAIIPELPKVLSKQQYLYYAPVASTESYGVVKIGKHWSDDDYYLTVFDGVINLNVPKLMALLNPYADRVVQAAENAEKSAEEAKANTISNITSDEDGRLYTDFTLLDGQERNVNVFRQLSFGGILFDVDTELTLLVSDYRNPDFKEPLLEMSLYRAAMQSERVDAVCPDGLCLYLVP